jgi:hypothetical protein
MTVVWEWVASGTIFHLKSKALSVLTGDRGDADSTLKGGEE